MSKHASIRKKVITIRPDIPWVNQGICDAKRKCRTLERGYRKNKLEVHKQIWKEQCSEVKKQIKLAKMEFLSSVIKQNDKNQFKLFREVNKLLHRGNKSALPSHTTIDELPDKFGEYFISKIDTIREGFPPVVPSHEYSPVTSSSLEEFEPVSVDNLTKVIKQTPSKQCSLDPLPTWILKECVGSLGVPILGIVNQSLQSGCVPSYFKKAVVTPLIKKPTLDVDNLKNFRPVSNLPVIAKSTEKIVAKQLTSYMEQHGLTDTLQSAYKQHHSAESALIRVHNDILRAVDDGKCVLLILLDLSAAFDTVDHQVLMQRLADLGITGKAHEWLYSYLTGRSQSITVEGRSSKAFELTCGVPQGSVLGPILFSIYISPLGGVIKSHNIDYHMYADDNELYIIFQPNNISGATNSAEQCVDDVRGWMVNNRLKLNDDKTDAVLIQSKYREQIILPSVRIGESHIVPKPYAGNLGAVFDGHFLFERHISRVAKSMNYQISCVGRIRKYLTQEAAKTYIHAVVTSKLDYANGLLSGLPSSSLKPLQRSLNTAARVVCCTRRSEHITPVLKSLHWLPVAARVEYKLLLMVHKALNGQAPVYIRELLSQKAIRRSSMRSNYQMLLETPKIKTSSYGNRAFSVAAPQLWNKLPVSLRVNDNLNQFKSGLKSYLFTKYYSNV
jgi:hypothetical protein